MHSRCRAGELAAVIVLCVAPAWAQSAPGDSLRVPAGVLRLTDVRERDRVRLRLLDEQCLEGTSGGFANGRLRLVSRPADIAVDSIGAIWVHENRMVRAATGAAFVGLIAGGIVAWQTDKIAYLFLVPFGITVAGSVAGSAASRWERVQLTTDLHAGGDAPCDPVHCLPCELAGLRPGNRVRVEAAGNRYLEGEIHHGRADSVSIGVGSQTDGFARAEIERLWVRRSMSGKTASAGIIIMAPIGAAAGALLFAAPSQLNPWVAGAIGAAMGGSAGALVGALVGAGAGAPFHAWVQLYP